jgi:protein-disulfide isomerase
MSSPSQPRQARLLRLGLLIGLAAVVVVAAIVLSSGSGAEPAATSSGSGSSSASGTPSDAAKVESLYKGIPQSSVTLGDPAAKATLIEFADLQCPFCAEYTRQAMPTVVERYVRPGTIRYELRIRAFLGKDSLRGAGAAAAAAEQNRLFQFADLFFLRQGEENSGYATDAFITSVAKDTGVDPAAAVAAAKNANRQPLVRAAEQKAQSLGSQSTPEFFLQLPSGRLVPVAPNDLTAAAMTEALDQALAET